MVSYWFIWLIHSLIIYQLSFSTKRSSSSALFKTSIPLHLLYNHQYMLCISPFTTKRRDCFPLSIPGVTGDKYVHLVTVSIHVLFVPPSPPLPLISVPDPHTPNWTGCLPVFLYMCIYIPGTLYMIDVITDHWINICFWFGVNIFLLVYRYIYVYTLCDTGMYTSDLDQWAWSILFLYIYTHQQNSNVHYWLLWWALSIDIYTSTSKSVLFICLFVIYIFGTIL